MSPKKHKEYYAVLEGYNLVKPTIFSSWAKAHLRVTGYTTQRKIFSKGYPTLKEAEEFMSEEGIKDYVLDIASRIEDTRPSRGAPAYYAVAHGVNPGIYKYYESDSGKRHCNDNARLQVDHVSGNCHKHFKTEAQAKAFIQDWTDAYLETVMASYAMRLTQGWRPALEQGFSIGKYSVPFCSLQQDSGVQIGELVGPTTNIALKRE